MAGIFVPRHLLGDPLALGFRPLGSGENLNQDSGFLVADLTMGNIVELAHRRTSPPPTWFPLARIEFPDPHPESWKQQCLRFGLLLLLTRPDDSGFEAVGESGTLWETVPLAVRPTGGGLLTVG